MSIIPFDDRDGVIWYDGKTMPWRDAELHVLSHGLHYGSCVFEGERRSEEHTSELQSLMRISYAVFCLKKQKMTESHLMTSTRLRSNINISTFRTSDYR